MSLLAFKFLIFVVLGAYVLAAPTLDEQKKNVQDTGVFNKQPTTSGNVESLKDDPQNISDKDDSGIDPEEDDDDDLENDNDNVNQQVSGLTKEVTPEPIKTSHKTKIIIVFPTNVTLLEPKSTDPNKSEEPLIVTGDLPKNLNGNLYQMGPKNPFGGILVHGFPVIFDDPKSPVHRIYYQPKV